jgi:hypothetical protein
MTDVVFKATKVKRKLKFALFIGKKLTKIPRDKSAVVSDLFPIKNDSNWKTEFELLNVAGLIAGDNNKEKVYQVNFYFFDEQGSLLGVREIQMENVGRKTIKLADYLIDQLKIAKTFAVFHPYMEEKFGLEGSFLAERGYSGYEYNNLGVKGYVHGNLDAVALVNKIVKPLGNFGIIPRNYTVQHCLTGASSYEFVFTNPTSRKLKITPNICHKPNHWTKCESFNIDSLGSYTYKVNISESEKAYVRFKSRLYLGRPVVFRIAKGSMDVFHG